MLKKVILFVLFLISPLLISFGSVFAQGCNPPYEMVTRLHKPEPGAYTVWNAVYGEPIYDEVFKSVLPIKEGGFIAVGERISFDGSFKKIVFVTYDRLGRQREEIFFELRGLNDVVKFLNGPDGGYLILANIIQNNRKVVWLGFFSKDKKFKSSKVISDKQDEVVATDVISSVDLGWVISVSMRRGYGEGKNRVEVKNGRVFLLSQSGDVLKERSYNPGGNNVISSLAVLKSDGEGVGYIATGYFVNNAGKQIAWSLRLDPNLALNWQREYSRGLLAKLNVSYSYLDDYILAFGDVNPVNGRPGGAWLALLDVGDGRILWQRYFYGEGGGHVYTAGGVFVNDDNLIVLMMMAEALKAPVVEDSYNGYLLVDHMDYAHLLTLSPRGIVLNGDTYFYGQGANVQQLVRGAEGERVMAGYVLVPEKESVVQEDVTIKDAPPLQERGRVFLPNVELSSKAKKGLELLKNKIGAQEVLASKELAKRENGLMKKGWIVIGDKLDTYNDPCSN